MYGLTVSNFAPLSLSFPNLCRVPDILYRIETFLDFVYKFPEEEMATVKMYGRFKLTCVMYATFGNHLVFL